MPNVRDVFFQRIYEYAKQGEDVVIVSADLGAPSLDSFRLDFGDRFINVGIAEQNLIAVASGLALSGKKVIAYGLNPFPVTRGLDQLRNLMESLRIPVVLAALNVGSCSAEAGYTHMPVETLATLRTFQNIRIVTPSDLAIAELAAEEAILRPQPMFIQFDKDISSQISQKSEISFSQGFTASGVGGGISVVTSGIFSIRAKSIQAELERRGIPIKRIDCFAIPMQEEQLKDVLKDSLGIVCIEDGKASGGLGSLLLELLNDAGMNIPIKRMGLLFQGGYPDIFLNRTLLHGMEGLSEVDIITKISSFYEWLTGRQGG